MEEIAEEEPAGEGAETVKSADSKPGEIFIKALPGARITFNII